MIIVYKTFNYKIMISLFNIYIINYNNNRYLNECKWLLLSDDISSFEYLRSLYFFFILLL